MSKTDPILQYTDEELTSQMYRNKKSTKNIGLFLGVLLCVFLAGCGCGGGGGDNARTPAPTVTSDNNKPEFSGTIPDQNYTEGKTIEMLVLPAATGGDGDLTYFIIGSPFGLTFDSSTRQLSGTPSGTGTLTVTYKVIDEDRNRAATDEDEIKFTINVAAGDTAPEFSGTIGDQNYVVGIEIMPLDLPDATGGNGDLSYSIIGSAPFGLMFDPSARQLSGAPSGTGTEMLTYKVADGDENTDATDENTLSFMITVAVDTAPQFVPGTINVPSYIEGITIMPLVLPEATGGNGALNYSITGSTPFGLTFDPSTRQLSGAPSGTGDLTVTYTVGDGDGNTQATDEDTTSFTITVDADTVPDVSGTIDDQNYIEGITITPLVLPEATGGNGALSYSIEPESPFGLTFDPSTRQLSGTPSGTRDLTVTYKVRDGDGNTQATDEYTVSFTITVDPDTAPQFSGPRSDLTFTEGVPIAWALPQATGGNGALSYSIEPESPFGLTFDLGLRGTPSGTGTVEVTYTVVDGDENTDATDTDTLTFRITVAENSDPFFTEEIVDQVYIQGRPDASFTLPVTLPEAMGGNGELTYSLVPQPDGMTFDSGTRELSGFPSAAILGSTTSVTYRATDIDGSTGELTFNVIYGTFQSKGICDRTPQVRDALLVQIRESTNPAITCDLVTALHLTIINELDVDSTGITSLKTDDFDSLVNLGMLDMARNSLETLPENLFDGLSSLTLLNLLHNNLNTLHENIFEDLSSLTEVYLGNNKLTTLPENLFQGISTLELISLGTNNLETLPENVFNGLSNLESLSMYSNNLETLPENVFNGLSNLESLSMFGNNLETLPENVFDGLSSLWFLRLSDNSLKTLHENIFDETPRLFNLSLARNYLETIPENIFDETPRLGTLSLNTNRLESLPENLFEGALNLYTLSLYNNNLQTLPADLFEGQQNMQTIRLDYNRNLTLPEDIFEGLGTLEKLSLNVTGQMNPSANLFNGLTSLRELLLGGNNMATPHEDLFNDLTSLTDLELRGNPLESTPAICSRAAVTCYTAGNLPIYINSILH